MSYRRIEVNLLPPELQPGPAIRSALIINIALILITAFTIILSAALSFYRMVQYRADIEVTTQNIENLASVKEGYEQLVKIDGAVLNYGKIVGIASTNYVDMPVLMSHLAGLLPQEVYLTNVANTRVGSVSAASVLDPQRSTFVSLSFNTSRKDLGLISRTLESLKQDPLFSNCVLTNAELTSEDYAELSEALGIDIMFDLPNSEDIPNEYDFYNFIIRAEIQRPLVDTGTRVLDDKLELFKASKPVDQDATAMQNGTGSAAGGPAGTVSGQPAADPNASGVVGGPEGVTGRSNRGGN